MCLCTRSIFVKVGGRYLYQMSHSLPNRGIIAVGGAHWKDKKPGEKIEGRLPSSRQSTFPYRLVRFTVPVSVSDYAILHLGLLDFWALSIFLVLRKRGWGHSVGSSSWGFSELLENRSKAQELSNHKCERTYTYFEIRGGLQVF